jgi:hypothetical protein
MTLRPSPADVTPNTGRGPKASPSRARSLFDELLRARRAGDSVDATAWPMEYLAVDACDLTLSRRPCKHFLSGTAAYQWMKAA